MQRRGAKPGDYIPGVRGIVQTAESFDALRESFRSWYTEANAEISEFDGETAGVAARNAEVKGVDPQLAYVVASIDSAKKRLPAFAPTVFRDNYRKLDTAERSSFYAGDLDGVSVEYWTALREKLNSAGLNWFAYGSPKFGIDKGSGPVSLRLCIETDRDTNADEARQLRKGVAELLHLERDTSADEPARLFFIGSVGDNPQKYFDGSSGGVPLAVDWTLSNFKGVVPEESEPDIEAISCSPEQLNTLADTLAKCFKDGTKNSTCFAFGGWAKQLGMPEEDVAYVVHHALGQVPSVLDIEAGVDTARRGYTDYNQQGFHKLKELLGADFITLQTVAPKVLYANVEGFEFANAPEVTIPTDDDDFPEYDDSGPKRQYLIPQLELGPGRINMIVGYSGSGKTITTNHLAFDIAMGRKVFDRFEIRHSSKVLIVAYEAPDLVVENLQRIALAYGVDYSELKKRVKVVQPLDANRTVIPMQSEVFRRKLYGMILRGEYGCVIIDTLRAATPGLDENAKEIAEPLYALETVSKHTQTTFIVLHHENKSEKASLEHKISGHASIHGTIQCAISIMKIPDQTDRRLVQQSKTVRRGFEPFEIEIVDTDAEGTPLSQKVPGPEAKFDLNEASPGVLVKALDHEARRAVTELSGVVVDRLFEWMCLHSAKGQAIDHKDMLRAAESSRDSAEKAIDELMRRQKIVRCVGDRRRYQLAAAHWPKPEGSVAMHAAPPIVPGASLPTATAPGTESAGDEE